MATTRPEAIEAQLKLCVNGLSGPEASALLAYFMQETLAAAIKSGEASERYTRVVNGIVGAPEKAVKLPGPIVYIFDWLDDVRGYAMTLCRELTAKRSGELKASWIAVSGGKILAENEPPIVGAELVISNAAPYFRKYEAWGKGKTRKDGTAARMSLRLPDGVIETAKAQIMRRFGNLVRVEIIYVVLPNAYKLRRNGTRARTGRPRKDMKAGDSLTVPALVINLRAA
jgi:hypothetical protein